jgi:4-diphosphocytidyl-2-C-methyl-D-erythritol kinase
VTRGSATRRSATRGSATRGLATGGASTLVAPAKINLTLEVVARLPNGYHGIRSVMLRLPRLVDSLRVRAESAGAPDVRIAADSSAIPVDAANVCHRAALEYLEHAGRTARVDIDIRKRIPVAAGLGGGSSDAAAVLLALNRHFDQAVPRGELASIGADIGKDVPFFLANVPCARASGMGEKIRPVQATPRLSVLVVNPAVAVGTKETYAALSRELWFMERRERADRTQAMVRALAAGDLAGIAAALYNDFALVVERAHPIVREVRQALLALGARGALMSGSGPTVFGLFASPAARQRAATVLAAHYPSFTIVRG